MAALSELDLLQVSTYQMSPEQQEIIRSRLLSKIMSALPTVSSFYLQHVAQLVSICKRYDGDSTPAEQLVMDLVGYCDGLTPDAATEVLERFRDNFDAAISTARGMASRYPDLVTGKSDADRQQAA